MEVFQTGAHYHLIHSLALVMVGILRERLAGGRQIRWAARLMLGGIVLFSGSLYALAITGIRGLGAITPLGGLCFLTAWALLVLSARRPSTSET
jgi:uncharacterized membrane protein YgdD (TMEM256/DUF423 family)